MPYSLEAVSAAFDALGGLDIPMVHIAGSKGKGTTATLLAKIIQLHGDRVGLFTSPFIEEEMEMVSVNGIWIAREDFARLKEKVASVGLELSEFELQTLAAFEYFKEQNCDVLVVECGLGGLTDATNVAQVKALTLLTHVELEHQEFLGNSLTEIARQKLGICRPGVPLMTVSTQDSEVFEEIHKTSHEVQIAPAFEVGHHHPESAGLAVAAADFLGYPLDSVIEEQLARLVVTGRFEILTVGVHTVILDGAHTYDSVHFVLERVLEYQHTHGLPDPEFGIHFLKDKNPELWKLFPRARTHWVPLDDERAGERPSDLDEFKLEKFKGLLNSKEEPSLFAFVGSFRLVKRIKERLTFLD